MKIIVLLILIISIASCSCPRVSNETFIRDTTYIAVPEIIQGDYIPQIINDTLIQYVNIKNTDTVLKLQYYPKLKTGNYFFKPDTIRVNVRDTLVKAQTTYVTEKVGFFKLLGYGALGFGIGILAIVLLAQYFTRKKLVV